MGRLKPVALARALPLAAAVAISLPVAAFAADMLPPPPPMMPPPPVEVGSGWYLRGDVGVGLMDLRKTIAVDASSPPAPYNYAAIQDHVSDQVFVGGGVGYQFTPWLRADLTGEYRTLSDWRFIAQDNTGGFSGGYNLTTGKFASVVGLANGYVDLGTWYGITPFVGAGVGLAHHMFQSVTDQGLGAYVGGFGYGGPKDKTNLAWALHAGLGYSVTPNLKLELAYRYLNMGDAQTGVVGCLPACPGNLRTIYKARDIESQDFKIGMRWMLGGPVFAAAAPAYYEPPPPMMAPPPPLVRKY